MNKNILYFSKNCKYSRKILLKLHHSDINHLIKKICIDGKVDTLPKYITSVPTLVLNRYPKPLVGFETITQWFKEREQRKNNISINKDNKKYKIPDLKNYNNSQVQQPLQQSQERVKFNNYPMQNGISTNKTCGEIVGMGNDSLLGFSLITNNNSQNSKIMMGINTYETLNYTSNNNNKEIDNDVKKAYNKLLNDRKNI